MIAPRETTVYEPRNRGRDSDQNLVRRREQGGRADRDRTPASNKNWRDSNDYRAEYFEKNRGIGGYGYVCSQCWKPMFKREQIQVDHIIPPSRFATSRVRDGKWVKTSIMARMLNNTFNCAAICPKCNGRKSNNINGQILHGYAMKSVEVMYGASQLLLSIPFMAVATSMWLTRKLIVASLGGGKSNGRRRRSKRTKGGRRG